MKRSVISTHVATWGACTYNLHGIAGKKDGYKHGEGEETVDNYGKKALITPDPKKPG